VGRRGKRVSYPKRRQRPAYSLRHPRQRITDGRGDNAADAYRQLQGEGYALIDQASV